MAFLSLSVPLSTSTPPSCLLSPSPLLASLASSSPSNFVFLSPVKCCFYRARAASLSRGGGGRRKSWIVGMAPEEEKMTRRSPLDFPIEWERPKPGRRPDIFPQFSPMKTPLPPPMPYDPPEEDEEEEEEKKEEEEENPEEQDPDKPQQQ